MKAKLDPRTEQRLAHIRAWGVRDARTAQGVAFNVPVFLQDYREKAAYVSGFLQETRRMIAASKGSA